jgi:hypothetical protein
MQVQNSVGNIYGLAVTKFYTSPIPEEGRLGLKTLYLQDKYLSMAAKDRGERERGERAERERAYGVHYLLFLFLYCRFFVKLSAVLDQKKSNVVSSVVK